MKAHWMTAAALSAALVAGCTSQNAQDTEDSALIAEDTTTLPEFDAPAGAPSSTVDTAPRPSGPASRPSQPARPAPAPSASRETSASSSPAQPVNFVSRTVRVAAGTALPLELQTALSSETATVEMPVQARLTQAISVDGLTVLPVGTRLNGEVVEVLQPGRVKGRARVSVRFTEAVIAGARERIATDPVTLEADSTKGEDATKIGVGAGVGAAIGGILGGGSGAAKGAAIGGAAGTGAVLATRGQHVDVAAGANIAATLAEPFDLRVRVQ